MTEKTDYGFDMVWINGDKFCVGKQLSDALKAEREKAEKIYGASWQEEHTARIRAETRLDIAERTIASLREQLEAERYDDR